MKNLLKMAFLGLLLLTASGCFEQDFNLKSTSPQNNDKNVPLNTIITLTFSGKEALSLEEINQENFKLALLSKVEGKKENKKNKKKGFSSATEDNSAKSDDSPKSMPEFKETNVSWSHVFEKNSGTNDKGEKIVISKVYFIPLFDEDADAPLKSSARYRLTINLVKSESGKYAFMGKVIEFTTADGGFIFNRDGENAEVFISPEEVAGEQVSKNLFIVDPKTDFLAEFDKPVNPKALEKYSELTNKGCFDEQLLRNKLGQAKKAASPFDTIAASPQSEEDGSAYQEYRKKAIEELNDEIDELKTDLKALKIHTCKLPGEKGEESKDKEDCTPRDQYRIEKNDMQSDLDRAKKELQELFNSQTKKTTDNTDNTMSYRNDRYSDKTETAKFELLEQLKPASDGYIRASYKNYRFSNHRMASGCNYNGIIAIDKKEEVKEGGYLNFNVLRGRGYPDSNFKYGQAKVEDWNEDIILDKDWHVFSLSSGKSKEKEE